MTGGDAGAEITAKRTVGEVVVRIGPSTLNPWADRASLEAGADAFSAGAGLRRVGGAWAELTDAEATIG